MNCSEYLVQMQKPWTPLHHAVLKRYRHLLKLLLDALSSLIPEPDEREIVVSFEQMKECKEFKLLEDRFASVGSVLRDALIGGFRGEVVEFLNDLKLLPVNLRTQVITTLSDCGKRVTPDSTKISDVICKARPDASIVDVWNEIWWPRRRVNHVINFIEQKLLTSTCFIGFLVFAVVLITIGLGLPALALWAMIVIVFVGFKVSMFNLIDPAGQQSVAAHVVALPGLSSYTTFRILIEEGSRTSVEIFDNPTMKALINALWKQVSLRFYIRTLAYVTYVLFFSTFASNVVSGGQTFTSIVSAVRDPPLDPAERYAANLLMAEFGLACAAQLINIYFLVREFRKAGAAILDGGFIRYINFWNMLQLSGSALVWTTFWFYVTGSDPVTLRIVGSVACWLIWINLLYFLKAFKSISFLIESLVTIMKDMIPFLIVVLVLLLSVVSALMTLLSNMATSPDPTSDSSDIAANPFGGFLSVLFKVYRISDGRLDVEDFNFVDPRLQIMYFMYFCFLSFFITTVALNALIALMTESHQRVTEQSLQQRFKLLAQIVLDEMRVMDANRSKEFRSNTRWIHVLSPSSDGVIPDAGLELWGGSEGDEFGMFQLKSEMKRMKATMIQRMDELATSIQADRAGGRGSALDAGSITAASFAQRTGRTTRGRRATVSDASIKPSSLARTIALGMQS